MNNLRIGEIVVAKVSHDIVPVGEVGEVFHVSAFCVGVKWRYIDKDRLYSHREATKLLHILSQTPQPAVHVANVTLPPGAAPVFNKQNHEGFDFSYYPTSYVSDEERAKRKAEGRCEECGKLLPMSIHGLGECPDHPKPLPPDFKQ